jgi:branched-chain amino acid transport system permease protein
VVLRSANVEWTLPAQDAQRRRALARAVRVAEWRWRRPRPSQITVRGFATTAIGAVLAVWLAGNFAEGPARFVNLVLIGVTVGALYGLIAVGYTLVYGLLERINFAHGDVFIFGAMIAASASRWLGIRSDRGLELWLDVAIMFGLAIVLSGLTSVFVERVAFRPFLKAPRLASLVTVIGVALVLENVALVWQGDSFNAVPQVLPSGRIFDVRGVYYSWDGLIVLTAAAMLALGLAWLIRSSRWGKAMRATSQDLEAAELVGVPVGRTITFTFLIGGALAGAAGALYLLYEQSINWDLGFHIGLVALSAAVLGGIGNPVGAVLGAVLLGLTQSFNEGFTWYAPGSDWTSSFVYSVLIATLVLRPQGMLGEQTPRV